MVTTVPMVFVTGASRSGTTLMSRILGQHSRIAGLKELHFFGDLTEGSNAGRPLPRDTLIRFAATALARQQRDLWGGGPNGEELARAATIVGALSPQQRSARDLFAAVVRQLAEDTGKQIPCEQTPRNIFYAADLLAWYPNARIVHMVRDPRAVLASQKNRWRMRRLGARNVPIGEAVRTRINYHPITMCRLWNAADEAAVHLALEPRLLTVPFEQLTDKPEKTVRHVCAFLDVPFEAGMLDVPLWGSSNVTHSSETLGIARNVAEQWADVLNAGEVAVCERLTGAAMERYGYRGRSHARRRGTALVLAGLSYPLHLAGVVLVNPYRAWIQARAILFRRRGGASAR